MILSTLCYLRRDDHFLMLLRDKKKKDVNEGKWIGVGGKFLPGECPEECVYREVWEETGYMLDDLSMRGVLTFSSKGWEEECIFVFVSERFHGTEKPCDEGTLKWVHKDALLDLNLWEGDRLFMEKLITPSPFFSLKLSYEGDVLEEQKMWIY